jgi:hypothetical protein
LFFDHEGADDALTNATGALVSTIGTRNGLLSLGNAGIVGGAKVRDTSKNLTTTSTLGSLGDLGAVVNSEATTRGSHNTGLVRPGGIGVASARGNTLNLERVSMSKDGKLTMAKLMTQRRKKDGQETKKCKTSSNKLTET